MFAIMALVLINAMLLKISHFVDNPLYKVNFVFATKLQAPVESNGGKIRNELT